MTPNRLRGADESAPPWWRVFIDAIDKLPVAHQPARLAKLAKMLEERGERSEAARLGLRAWRQLGEGGAGKSDETLRHVLAAVTAKYQVQIATDEKRIAVWEQALANIIRPGMLVLEIGTGSGILAMLAARAGADVVSCEKDPVLAAIAEATVRRNGLSAKIRIVGKSAQELSIPADLARPADILLLDIFSDQLFSFRPFETIRSVRRLLRPGAIAVPARVSLQAALANFRRWHRIVPGRVSNFDLGILGDISEMRIFLDCADPDLSIHSNDARMVNVALLEDLPGVSGAEESTVVSLGGPVNGVAMWLRLQLTAEHILEAKPGAAPRGFYGRTGFFAFGESLSTTPGQRCPIRLHWEGKSARIGLAEP